MSTRLLRRGRSPGVCIYQRFMPPDYSGAGKQALTLAHAVAEAGWDVVLLTDGDPRLTDRIEGFPVERVAPLPESASYPQLLAYWSRVARALARLRERFDVVHVHNAHFRQAAAVPLARMLGKRVIVRASISGEFAEISSSRSGRVKQRMFQYSDAFVVLSERLAQEYAAAGMPRERLNLIPNGVDTEAYRPADTQEKRMLREELKLPRDSRILVYHGVFIERKSLHWIIDVLGPLLADLHLTLLLVGGPAREEASAAYAESLRGQIAGNPNGDRVIVRPHDPAVEKYLRASDAYILASTGEGLPNALLEAMATGLVPIVSRTSGTEDVVQDHISGLLFQPRDEASLKRCVHEVFDGSEAAVLREQIGVAAIERVRECYSIQATAQRYVQVYSRLCGQDGR